ncbi:MAG: iron hydrogenase [bacterium]|nr:iron hydrogenase [bacterium]
MEKIKTIAASIISSKMALKAMLFCLFLGISLAAPFIKIQLVTGTAVNAVLFASTMILGVEAGILIGFLPSMVSAFSGLLPVALLPMIPYIIASNAILVLVFGLLRKRNFWVGAVLASIIKFAFLFVSSSFIIGFFLQKPMPKAIISMMGFPQLITALAGAITVYALSFFINFKNAK